MSFRDYVNHINQKYRLAVAIAVLKNKPEKNSIQEYITILRNKISEKMEIDDLDITIDSDDFKFDDDDAVNGIDDDGTPLINDNEAAGMTILKEFDVNMKSVEEATSQENHIQTTYFESTQATNISTISETSYNNNLELYCNFDHNYAIYEKLAQNEDTDYSENIDSRIAAAISKNINKDVASANTNELREKEIEVQASNSKETGDFSHRRVNKNKLADKIYKHLNNSSHVIHSSTNNTGKAKNTAKNPEKSYSSPKSNKVKKMTSKSKEDPEKETVPIQLQETDHDRDTNEIDGKLASKIYNNINKTNEDNKGDSQSTLIYTLYGFTQDLSHVSQSQFDSIQIGQEFIIGNKHTGVQDDTSNNVNEILINDCNNVNKNTGNSIQDFSPENYSQSELLNDYNVRNNQNFHVNDYIHFSPPSDDYSNIGKNNQNFHGYDFMNFNPPNDFNNIEKGTVHNNQQYLSENTMKIDLTNNSDRYTANKSQDFLCDEKLIFGQPNNSNNVVKNQENSQEVQTQIIQVENIDKNISNEILSGKIQIVSVDTNNIQYIIDKNGRKYAILNTNDKINESIAAEVSEKINSQLNETQSERYDFPENNANISMNMINAEDNRVCALDSDDDLTVTQKEIVPFKVIEELNKVKTFLNKKDGTSDSGYKSDSQGKGSYKSALQSGNSLNQSAHCLFSYLLHCSNMLTTQEIANEISQVLGKLIDRLHEEETYPSFLDDILENIDKFLQEIYEGESTCDNVLQKKDECIQRIFLLNKSLHIIKYTIEKITDILEKICNNLTTQGMYEIANIDKTENVCYIFHILEFLIQKHIKNKNLTQENTQPSQNDEKILKKSSITDIWRKKWNPDYKSEEKVEDSVEKKCVLIKCSEVLNKIIVDCMNGYSLVAFAALQCFNLLQS